MSFQRCQCCRIPKRKIDLAIRAIEDLIPWRDPIVALGERTTRSILGKIFSLEKQNDPDILSEAGFLEWVLTLALDLRLADRVAIGRSVDSLRDVISVNWPDLSLTEVDGLLVEIVDLIAKVRNDALGLQMPLLTATAGDAITAAELGTGVKLGIGPVSSVFDPKMILYLLNSTANFMRDRNGKVVNAYSIKARRIIADGLDLGLPSRKISQMLAQEFQDVQTRGYYNLIANQFVNGARSYGSLVSMSEAGIELAEISAVLDERTTDTCFEKSTPIVTENGVFPISEVQVGMRVLTGSKTFRRVRGKSVRNAMTWCVVRLSSGNHLIVTPNHLTLMGDGWKRAGDLLNGDLLASNICQEEKETDICKPQQEERDQETRMETSNSDEETAWQSPGEKTVKTYLSNYPADIIVESVKFFEHNDAAYNLEVEDDPTYFASNVLVHNCRFLDGKIINVNDSVGLLERLAETTDPGTIKDINPWIHEGGDANGKFLYIESADGSRREVARVVRSGLGIMDDRGEYSNGLGMDELSVMGIGPPPYHAFCRTTLIPVIA